MRRNGRVEVVEEGLGGERKTCGHCGGGRGRPDRFEIPASAKPYWGQHHIPLIINASRRRLSMTGQTYARYSTVKRGFA